MKRSASLFACCLLVFVQGPARAAEGDGRPGEHAKPLVIALAGTYQPSLSQTAIAELARGRSYRLLPLEAVHPLLRQHDAGENLLQRIQTLREEGHQALLALDQGGAEEKLEQASRLLERSFARFYEPALAAEIHVLRGVAALRASRPDLAREEFVEAHQLYPALELDAHYSPQVRSAFTQASRSSPTQSAPTPTQLGALLRVVGNVARAVVVLVQPLESQHRLAQLLVFDPARERYVLVESAPIPPGDEQRASREAMELGRRVRGSLDGALELRTPGSQLARARATPKRQPSARPWYKRWYVWAAAGLVLASVAVTVPLATRREVVDLDVNWR